MGFLDWLFEPSTEYSSDFFRWDRKGTLYRGEYYKEGSTLYAHGKGHMIFADGGEYEGNFEHSKYHGYGIKRYSNGNYYEGHWIANKKYGEGTLHSSSGFQYSGTWIDGQLPHGEVIYPDGTSYLGDLDDHLRPHGHGTYYSAPLTPTYSGRWNHGDMTD